MGRKKTDGVKAEQNASLTTEHSKPDLPLLPESRVAEHENGNSELALGADGITSLLHFFKLLHKWQSESRR